MPRVKKPQYRKAVNLMTTVPVSFRDLCHAEGTGASEILQMAIAERVIGVTPAEFEAYWDPTKVYKPESWKKGYIRTARWILESKIEKMQYSANERTAVLDVYWNLTRKRAHCSIRVTGEDPLYHVLYDATHLGLHYGLYGPRYLHTLIQTIHTTRAKILRAWLTYSAKEILK